ncbi:MAG: Uncharacterised protein [Cryomorphaceae bacterium]|nr:MAG: Uncharacterised protein [Cryomorphaceae bacterium]
MNGVLLSFKASKKASSPVSVTETTTLDGASPNRKASSLTSELPIISNPKLLVNELSSKVINKPPSATSCADSIVPLRIRLIRVCCISYSISKSNSGVDDSLNP